VRVILKEVECVVETQHLTKVARPELNLIFIVERF
jgi:hypothetical protein